MYKTDNIKRYNNVQFCFLTRTRFCMILDSRYLCTYIFKYLYVYIKKSRITFPNELLYIFIFIFANTDTSCISCTDSKIM